MAFTKNMNKFKPLCAWRLRQELDKYLSEVTDLAEMAQQTRKDLKFDYKNFGFCVNQLVVRSRELKKFYDKNK